MWTWLSSWLRESVRTSLLYLAVGASSIPWAFAYALLVYKGWDNTLMVGLLLIFALTTAHMTWSKLNQGRSYVAAEIRALNISQSVSTFAFLSQPQTAIVAPAILVLCLTVHAAPHERTVVTFPEEAKFNNMTATNVAFLQV